MFGLVCRNYAARKDRFAFLMHPLTITRVWLSEGLGDQSDALCIEWCSTHYTHTVTVVSRAVSSQAPRDLSLCINILLYANTSHLYVYEVTYSPAAPTPPSPSASTVTQIMPRIILFKVCEKPGHIVIYKSHYRTPSYLAINGSFFHYYGYFPLFLFLWLKYNVSLRYLYAHFIIRYKISQHNFVVRLPLQNNISSDKASLFIMYSTTIQSFKYVCVTFSTYSQISQCRFFNVKLLKKIPVYVHVYISRK